MIFDQSLHCPVLSKIYKRLIHNQVVNFFKKNHHFLADTFSGFRKGHSTTSVLFNVRDEPDALCLSKLTSRRLSLRKQKVLDSQGHTFNGQSTSRVEENSFFKLMTVFQNLFALALEFHKARSPVLSFLTYILLICKGNLIVLAISMLMIQSCISRTEAW